MILAFLVGTSFAQSYTSPEGVGSLGTTFMNHYDMIDGQFSQSAALKSAVAKFEQEKNVKCEARTSRIEFYPRLRKIAKYQALCFGGQSYKLKIRGKYSWVNSTTARFVVAKLSYSKI